MIVAVTSLGNDLESPIDSRFGRAKTIIIYNTDDNSFETCENNVNLNAAQGAGIQTAQLIVESKAEVLLTGNLGPKAFKVLAAGNVTPYTVDASSVQEAIELFKQNKLEIATAPNVEGHWI